MLLGYARLFLGGLILALLATIAIQSSQIHKWHTQADKQAAARAADRATYEAAQAQAAAANSAEVKRIEQQQQKVTEDVETRYRSDLARLRAERLPARTAAPQGAPNGTGAGGAGQASGGPCGEALPLPADDLLRAQETELQLNALIDWVLGQSEVNPNK